MAMASTVAEVAEANPAIDTERARQRTVATMAREGRREGYCAPVFSHILACVDGSRHAADVVGWAVALARNLNASLRTLQVLDATNNYAAPQDPITWELRRSVARNQLGAFLERAGFIDNDRDQVEVAVGPFHDRFCAELSDRPVDLCVIGAIGATAQAGRFIGDTARRIVETAPCSVLIVPPQAADDAEHGATQLRRLMVPLDCSRRAETALPAAIALADAFRSEIVIAHAVPEPAITEIGPPDEADIELRKHVSERNRKAAERYVSRLRARLALDRRPIHTLILSGADPRHLLVRAAADQSADLIVLSAKGAGGHADQSLGSVADFLVTHINKPLLIIRPGPERKPKTAARLTATAGAKHSIATRV